MENRLAIRTDLFEHREVKAHFINPCCFGEDFAVWLGQQLRSLEDTITSGPIQEDYGWGVWARCAGTRFWIALSYVGNGPQEEPPEWVLTICGPGFFARLLHADESRRNFRRLRDFIWSTLALNPAINVLDRFPDDRT